MKVLDGRTIEVKMPDQKMPSIGVAAKTLEEAPWLHFN